MMKSENKLETLRTMGTTILVVTHDCELIHLCCSRKVSISG